MNIQPQEPELRSSADKKVSEVNEIIYARTGALGGGRTHTWRIFKTRTRVSAERDGFGLSSHS
jgi:hypothetical protein